MHSGFIKNGVHSTPYEWMTIHSIELINAWITFFSSGAACCQLETLSSG